MQDDSILEEQVHLSDDEDSENDHQPKADLRKDWWKPLPEEERPVTPKPAWTIPSSNKSDVVNEVVKAFTQMSFTFSSRWRSDTRCSQLRLTRQIQKEIKSESMSTDRCLLVVLQGSNPALLISKMKAASYLDFGIKLLVSEQMWIDDVCTYDISAKYGISHWWFNRQKFYIDRHDSPSRRKDARRFLVSSESKHTQDTRHLDHLPGSKKQMLSTVVKLWTRNLVIRQLVEDFQLGIESYQTQLNLTKPGWDATS
ncbi:hypothetical protein Tco_0215700 [Tanacetum coccineum]